MNDLRKIKDLHGWEYNPRTVTKEGIGRLIKQIKKLGIYKPLLITKDGTVLGGNLRLQALKQIGEKEVWVSVVDADTEEKKIEYALSDNDRVGKYEGDQLANLIGNFPKVEWNDYAVDIKEPQLVSDLMDQYSEVIEDEVPEVPKVAKSKLGEVYELGRHRLMCGSATDIEAVNKLVQDNKVDLIITDPPYNTGMQPKYDSSWMSHIFADNMTREEYQNLIKDSLANMFTVSKGKCVFYVFIDWRNVGLIKGELENLMPVHNVIVWDKVVHGLGSDYKFTYEMCVVGKKGKPEINNRIGSDYQDIWRVQRKIGRNEEHATAKPLELIKKPIIHASKEDDIVLDLFGGSGSTLIACEQTNRVCYMMELSCEYIDVIIKRWENFTGQKAVKLNQGTQTEAKTENITPNIIEKTKRE